MALYILQRNGGSLAVDGFEGADVSVDLLAWRCRARRDDAYLISDFEISDIRDPMYSDIVAVFGGGG